MAEKDLKVYDFHARVQIDLTSDDPAIPDRIIIYPKLKFGPHIYFASFTNLKETKLVIDHDQEARHEVGPMARVCALPYPGRHFLGLNLYAIMEPCNDQGTLSLEVLPAQVDAFKCDITAPHPSHLVDENGIWSLTEAHAWCTGRGELEHD